MQNHCFCNQKSDPYSQIITPISQHKNHPIFQPSDHQSFTKFARFPNLKPTSHSPPNSSFSGVLKNSLCQAKCRFYDRMKNTHLCLIKNLLLQKKIQKKFVEYRKVCIFADRKRISYPLAMTKQLQQWIKEKL